MINKLIGFQLVKIDEKCFSISKDNETKNFEFIRHENEDGYNELRTELLISNSILADNPVITDISYERSVRDDWGDFLKITFSGVDLKLSEKCKKLAIITSFSSSDSCCCYGSYQSVRCVETSEEEILTEW